jgi:predicted phosphodiesterase
MLHIYIALAYIIPNIYLLFRINNLFISKGCRLWYFVLYILIVAIYPLTESFSHREMSFFMGLMSTISGYILPFFLYLFLCVLLCDLFLLLNLLFKIVSIETRKTFSFRFYTLSTMIILSVAAVAAGAINLNTIRVSKYRVEVPRRHSNIDHLRIAFVADIHIQQNTRLSFIEQLARKVNALQPDLMLYGGDIVEGDRENETTEAIESIMRTIHAKYGVFGVTGNHYSGKNKRSHPFLSGLGEQNKIYIEFKCYQKNQQMQELLEQGRSYYWSELLQKKNQLHLELLVPVLKNQSSIQEQHPRNLPQSEQQEQD